MRAACAAIAALISLLALSCNNSFGILQTIQGEKKQNGASIFQETAVFNAFRLGSNYYAVTGGTLQYSAVGADSWSSVPIVSGGYALRGAVLAGTATSGTIFALIETGGEASLGIAVYQSSDGSTWTKVNNLPPENPTGSTTQETTVESLDALYTANGQVYAEYHSYVHNPNSTTQNGASTYTLYYYDHGSDSFKLVSGITPWNDETFRGVVYDGTYYWFASEYHLFVTTDQYGATDPTGRTSAVSTMLNSAIASEGWSISTSGVASSWGMWAISFTGDAYSDPAVYLSTKGGYLVQYKVGASSATVENVNTSVPLTQVTAIPAASGYSIVVGTDAIGTTAAVGYYEGSFGSLNLGSSGSVAGTSATSVFSTTVSTAPVHVLFYDAAGATALLCVSPGATSTSYYGLYASSWAAGSLTWSGWAAQ
jgi:hypothetical protein